MAVVVMYSAPSAIIIKRNNQFYSGKKTSSEKNSQLMIFRVKKLEFEFGSSKSESDFKFSSLNHIENSTLKLKLWKVTVTNGC